MVTLAALLCVAAVAFLGWRGSGGPGDAPVGQTTRLGSITCTPPPAAPAQPQTFDAPPDPSLAESSTWTATLRTNCGDITLELYGDKAPQTVASFVFLAQHDYWVDSPCHRLTTQGLYVLQCGDPTGSGSGEPGYTFGLENAPADGSFPTGTVAMARTNDPDTNGGQFFLVYDDTSLPTDTGGYSIFGRVTDGLDIVDAIARRGVAGGATDGAPAQPISLLSVTVVTAT